MAKGNGTPLTDELYAYMLGHNPPLDPVQRMLVEVTHTQLPLVAGKQVAAFRFKGDGLVEGMDRHLGVA